MVGVYINMGFVKVASPHGECMHDGKFLSIMEGVIHLCRVELARLECYGLEAIEAQRTGEAQ